MFEQLIDAKGTTKNNDFDLNFDFKRVWRLCSRMNNGRQKKTNKGLIFNTITPNAFDIRPNENSVSLNKLHVESDDENYDCNQNRIVMSEKINDSKNENKIACIFLDRDGFDEKIKEDPLSIELMSLISIERTHNGSFSHDSISACHYDLFYKWGDGSIIDGKSPYLKSDIFAQIKRFICEVAKIPQHSIMREEDVIAEESLFQQLLSKSVVCGSTNSQ